MPCSMPYNTSTISEIIWRTSPKSIIDIGSGGGKYGVIFRELTDWMRGRYYKNQWKIKIDCVEIFEKYITPIHQYIYDKITIGDIREIEIEKYDLIFMGDVLEHIKRNEAINLFKKIHKSNSGMILISTPDGKTQLAEKRNPHGNDNESHVYMWNKEELENSFEDWNVLHSSQNKYMITVLYGRK